MIAASPSQYSTGGDPRTDDDENEGCNAEKAAELVEPIAAGHKALKPAFHFTKTTFSAAKPHRLHFSMTHKYGQIVNKREIEFEQKLDLISIYMCYRYIDFFQRNHFFVFSLKVIIIL